MIGPQPICTVCTRRRPDLPGFACDAFPAGIPIEIVRNQADHRRPLLGDNGLRFEADDSRPALARAVVAAAFPETA